LLSKSLSWYTNKQLLIVLFLLFVTTSLTSLLIPPLQSPDEPNHLKRAYLLSKGEIFLDSKDGITGGMIDEGLIDFEHSFSYLPFNEKVRVNPIQVADSKKIYWANQKVFSGLPNTAAYFPISYLPQAIGLAIGESTKLSISNTYYLCRIICLLFTLTAIYFSSRLFPIPALAFSCLLIPMSIFQLGSASLDSFTYGLCFLIAALFCRVCQSDKDLDTPLLYVLALCLLAVTTTRINFLTLTLLPLYIYFYKGKKIVIALAFTTFLLTLSWSLYALSHIEGLQTIRQLSTIQIIHYYLSHPMELIKVFFNTFTKWGLVRGYWETYIGRLGWLDTRIPDLGGGIYVLFFLGMAYLANITKINPTVLLAQKYRLFFLANLFIGFAALFAILLFAWTQHPAKIIEGIQGRYFTPFVIFISYAMFDNIPNQHLIKKIRLILSATFFISMILTIFALYNRYW
jgi:uncharacterized membrane protein